MHRICLFDGRNCGNNCLQTTQVEPRKDAQQANSTNQQVFMVKENERSYHTHMLIFAYSRHTHAYVGVCRIFFNAITVSSPFIAGARCSRKGTMVSLPNFIHLRTVSFGSHFGSHLDTQSVSR